MDRLNHTLNRSDETASSSSAPLRVAILSYRSDPRVGGQGVYVDYLSRALCEAGARVDVISGPPYPELDVRVRLIRLASLDLYAQPHNGHYALRPRHLLSPTDTYEYFGHLSGKFVEPYTFGQRAYAYLRRHRHAYDVVLDNQTLATGTLKLQQKLGLPLVTMIHHPITRDRRLAIEAAHDATHRWLARRWYSFHRMQIRVARQLDVISCPSEQARQDIVSEFGVSARRVSVIPLGVDQQAFRPIDEIEKAPCQIITMASSDTPLKGLSILLRAYHQLLQSKPEAELVVIGRLREGEARRTLDQLGLENKVRFRSGLSRSDLAEAFNRATVAVTPSLYEGFGLPAAEAMSCGTPVIVTDGGALPEVAGQAGLIVPKGSADALTAALLSLLDQPERCRQVAEACLHRAREVFDWQKIAPLYLAQFRQTMAQSC